MTARTLTLICSAALLAACATAQENPNYQYSSKYNPDGERVQLAGYAQPAPTVTSANYDRATYETVPVALPASAPASGPVSVPAYSAPVSETEQAFDASTMDGTPGYALYAGDAQMSAPAPALEIAPAAPQGRAVTYDYSQNVIVAGTQSRPALQDVRAYGAAPSALQAYTVQPGDTVYSLARLRCVALSDVTQPNAIGSDYAIAIGQRINLPATRC